MTGKLFQVCDFDSPNVREQIIKGARDTGIFYVKNHGVSQQTIDQMFSEFKDFFACPLEKKIETKQSKDNMTGFTIMEQEKLDELAVRGDTKEGYQLRVEENPGLNKVMPNTFTDHQNRWPDPKRFPNLKPVTIDYLNQTWDLAFKIIHMIAESLHLAPTHFDQNYKDPFVSLRPLHYSSEISQPDQRIWGCGAHTDYGFITLLTSDENDGLQIFDEEQNQWHDVKPIPGTFIIFIGDMLKGITGGYLRSAIHRVVNEKGVDRYSCALFFDPDLDASCEQIPTLAEFVKRPYKFPFKTYGEYLEERYSKTYTYFKE